MFEVGNIATGDKLYVEAQHAARVTLRGVDYGAFGSYAKGLQSGFIAAGMSAAAPVYAFRYTGAQLCLVRRVRMSACNIATAFAAGVARFDLFAARSFSASDTGGTAATLTGAVGKLRTSMATTAIGQAMIATTGANSAGTRTLDADPLASLLGGVVATAGIGIVPPNTPFWESRPGEQTLVLANNEGFVIQGTVPATGTWALAVSVEYDEVALASW